ncbi:MAG: hypothetical protein OEY86_12250 [Nitrospira sp.]|nr:hypothetical protein [Nitrospira sp.]
MMRDRVFSPVRSQEKGRIETQIHRRRAAKAAGPMEAEWDDSHDQPPTQLRLVLPSAPRHQILQEATAAQPSPPSCSDEVGGGREAPLIDEGAAAGKGRRITGDAR